MEGINYDVAIIGGGASGMACAVRLAESGKKINVIILEAGERLGKKLAATGNGQGNVSNLDMTPAHYFGGGAYLAERIACKNAYDGCKLFDCLFSADETGKIYPTGRQASALTDNFIRKLDGRCEIVLGAQVKNIGKENGAFKIEYSNRQIFAKYVVLCTGGKAQRQFKTDGSSYALAQKLGHTITSLYPSLVQLKTDTDYIKTLKGIRAYCKVTAVSPKGKKIKTVSGDVIFTDYGVSGNAIFSLSAYVADKPDCSLSLEFLPDISKAVIKNNIEKRKSCGCKTSELLSGTLHNQLGRAVIARSGGDGNTDEIVNTLKNFVLKITGTLGFDYAQVTKGGVDVKDITDELESRYADNLFFAGEILDVDGDCGGYNLQWAFTSAMQVADVILSRL